MAGEQRVLLSNPFPFLVERPGTAAARFATHSKPVFNVPSIPGNVSKKRPGFFSYIWPFLCNDWMHRNPSS